MSTLNETYPDVIPSEHELNEILSRPRGTLVEMVGRLKGPLMILGAAGKMGPSLALMVRRAAEAAGKQLEIIAVSRFSSGGSRMWFEGHGIRTLSCDLLKREEVRKLPEAADILYMVGLKFGTQQNPSMTWAVNTLVPAWVSERYAQSRIVALSTGNVYPLVPVDRGGAKETDALTPVGEYANAAVARERIFEYFSRENATRMTVLRLNYAVELRYGVLLDIAQLVWSEKPVDVTMGCLNCIWQRDANEYVVRALEQASSPPTVYNMTGAQALSVRQLALRFGELMNRQVEIVGREGETALLSDSGELIRTLGEPPMPIDRVMGWIAQWVMSKGPTHGKPTHFEVRDGKY